jgi:hypothetical protein
MDFLAKRLKDGALEWDGKYQGAKVLNALPIDNGTRCVVLLDWTATDQFFFENLLCIDRSGNVVWTAEFPQQQSDAYVDVQVTADAIVAHSMSCYLVTLDRMTGRIITRTFTK